MNGQNQQGIFYLWENTVGVEQEDVGEIWVKTRSLNLEILSTEVIEKENTFIVG